MTKAILDNLWQVGGDNITASGDAAVYLVRFGDNAALIDAGTGQRHGRLKANIAHCLPAHVSIDYLFLTHCHYDHTGGAQQVKDEYGCRIVAHALDAVYLEAGDSHVTAAVWYGASLAPLPIDLKLEGDRNEISIGSGTFTAIHCPGHSPGSVIYATEVEGELVVFGQDVHGPIHPTLKSDEKLYQASLDKILELDADLLLEGHFGIFRGKGAVRKFIKSYMR